MSNLYHDPSRKVSEPTEADFVRGMASSITNSRKGANVTLALIAGLLVGRAIRRRK